MNGSILTSKIGHLYLRQRRNVHIFDRRPMIGHNTVLEWLPLCFQKPTQNRALYCEHLNCKVQKNDTIMCIMDKNEIPDTYLRQGDLKNCETVRYSQLCDGYGINSLALIVVAIPKCGPGVKCQNYDQKHRANNPER